MHGQKRSEYKSRLLNPETSSKLATKAQQWNHLSHELLTQRRRLFSQQDADDVIANDSNGVLPPPKPSPDILVAITEKMLSVNPDPIHLWNIRREMLLYAPAGALADPNATSPHHDKKSSLDIHAELALTAHCLKRNPKSYSAWYHRKWSLVYSITHPSAIIITTTDNGDGSNSNNSNAIEELHRAVKGHLMNIKEILKSELGLCAQFLQMDERNFHCWNYRRFVVALLGSCGGFCATTTTSPSSAVRNDVANEMIDELDRDLFTGSWSSWLNPSSTTVTMGAQSSSRGQKARGIPYHFEGQMKAKEDEEAAYSIIAKSIVPLSQEELNHIIINEWDFTTAKIHDNFSNGSAFHYRSKLLPLILESRLLASPSVDKGYRCNRYDAILALARAEWESILLNAIFTEPDDQTPWWYHRFIVSWIKPSNYHDGGNDEMQQECESLLYEMANSLRELLEVEKGYDVLSPGGGEKKNNNDDKDESKGVKCKWAYLGLHLVLSTILEVFQSSMDDEQVMELKIEAEECLRELMRIDPNRKERYQNLAVKIT